MLLGRRAVHSMCVMLAVQSALLLLALHQASGQTTAVCSFLSNITYQQTLKAEVEIIVTMNSAAVSGSGVNTIIHPAHVDYVKFTTTLDSLPAPLVSTERSVEMIDSTASPPRIQLSTKLSHTSNSSGNVSDVWISEDLSNGLQAFFTAGFLPGNVADFHRNFGDRTYYHYTPSSSLNPGDNATVRFEAEASGDPNPNLMEGITDFLSVVRFNHSSGGSNFNFGTLGLEICLDTTYKLETSIFYQHGFTALTFFFALLLGFLLVALGVFLFLFVCRRRNKSSVSPSRLEDQRMKETSMKIVTDPKVALQKGFNVIKDNSIMKWNESIVLILSQKDKLHMFREIDNLDVLATIVVDTDLEQEQNDAAVQTSFLLLQGLRHNGDISKGTEDAATQHFNRQIKDLDKKLEADYKKELQVVYTDLSAKNKERLAELLHKHRAMKQQAGAATKELPPKERQGLLDLIERQQQLEQNELTFTLALEQNEEAEKLRKEFAIRKRMGIKEAQQNMISEVISKGQLKEEQADWILKEHKKQQEAVHRMYDEEISRQRMVLEEKLARRRALAQASETQDDDHKEELNLTAAHVAGYLLKAKKKSCLSEEQSEELIEQMKAQALAIKAQMDTANDGHEKELHKNLSNLKVARLNELIKKHEAEIQEFVKKNKTQQSEGPVDPVSYAEGLLKMKSQHRVELTNMENELDADHASQLTAARDKEAAAAQEKLQELERDTVKMLQEEGMSNKVVETLLKKYNEETEDMKRTHEQNRRNQEDKLKEELARRKREWIGRREKERQEQEDLREHEADVVEKLVNSQVSMSEAERERIMKEHEKQMVLLENSLTLNKLRQQRALEERLNQRRAQQIGKLQTQQQSEVKKHRKMAENNGEEDDEETHRETLELMKKHAQQRIAVMQGSELNIDEELEQIRIEMIKERALALKSQEERLGAMITALQMEKAREMTQIEEQQKAINNLKANLMDDLNERGILSTPECERILDRHKEESEAMNQRLETQRNKQEGILRQKLQERMKQREQLMLARQESEMRQIMDRPGSKFSAKVRRAMLVHKHVVEMEKFRHRMEREISQSLADTKRQFDVLKLQEMQKQELSFVAGLVRVGAFQEHELMDVLHMLFPGKTEQDVQKVFDQIMEGTTKPAKDDMSSKSSIVERVYQALFLNPSMLNRSGSVMSDRGQKKKRLGKKSSRMSMTFPGAEAQVGMEPRGLLGAREEPASFSHYPRDMRPGSGVGRRRSSAATAYSQDYGNHYDRGDRNYDDDGTDYIAMGVGMSDRQAAPVGRLAPLRDQEQPGTKRKKKKGGLLKKHRQQQQQHLYDDDEL